MATRSDTASETRTVTAGDVRQVMALTSREITTICNAAKRAARDFDVDSALVDTSLLALNDIIDAIKLQIYVDGEVVREYAFEIADEPLEASGPPPEQPPMGRIPDGARIRLVVTENQRVPRQVREDWFKRLGWGTAEPLRKPEGVSHETYGTFASGGFGLYRRLLVNPRFDRPLAAGAAYRKER